MVKEKFYQDYLQLTPESASLLDLLRILCLYEIDKIKCVKSEALDKLLSTFERRWLISMSLLAQKGLYCIRGRLAKIGSGFEWWLNRVSNKEVGVAGAVEPPIKYATIVGNLDPRVELDKSITSRDSRYRPSLSMMAAKLSYENKNFVEAVVRNHWKMEFLGFYELWNDYQQERSTYAIMLYDPIADLIVVAFRGTNPIDADAWITDFSIEWYDLQPKGKIHAGFMKALGLRKKDGWPMPETLEPEYLDMKQKPLAYYKIRQDLRDILMDTDKRKKKTKLKKVTEATKFIVTGHSLGGALAILFVGLLAYHEDKEELASKQLIRKLEGVYTFGQPRVGDGQFAEFMKEKMSKYRVKYLRYVYSNDIVPRLPFDHKSLMYKHFGRCLYFNSCYRGKLLWEEPNKNYFALRWELHKCLSATWELIRGFIIQYTKGSEYKEGWFLILLRVFGLLIPGVSAHSPQDYVNVTRLGSLPFNLQDLIHEERLKCD